MNARELEKATEEFLRTHDTYYKSKNKKRVMEYPYLSRRQTQIRANTEIPVSALSKGQRRACCKLTECVEYDEE